MSRTDMLKDLRTLTQAGMRDCKDALVETNWDLQNAVDLIKQKGKKIVAGKRISAEGLVSTRYFGDDKTAGMVEVNCVTDFVARSPEFLTFCKNVLHSMYISWMTSAVWSIDNDRKLKDEMLKLISITKEDIQIRRWWVEQYMGLYGKVFSYVHPNPTEGKIGVLLSFATETEAMLELDEFLKLGDDLAMQIAAMSPLAVSPNELDPNLIARQVAIFKAQIKELNKPAAAIEKIMEGKMNKWHKEVCLLNQESVIHSKVSVASIVENISKRLGGKIKIIGFTRCEVGEGIEKETENFADEAMKMVKDSQKV